MDNQRFVCLGISQVPLIRTMDFVKFLRYTVHITCPDSLKVPEPGDRSPEWAGDARIGREESVIDNPS